MFINIIAGAAALVGIAMTPPTTIAPSASPVTTVQYQGNMTQLPPNYEVLSINWSNGGSLRVGGGNTWEEMAADNRNRVAFRFNQVSWNKRHGLVLNDPSRNISLWVNFANKTIYWAQSGSGQTWAYLTNIRSIDGPDGEVYR